MRRPVAADRIDLSRIVGASVVVAIALTAGVAAAALPLIALALAGGVLVGGLMALRRGQGGVRSADAEVWWIPYAWVAFLLFSHQSFSAAARSPLEAAQGSASVENLVEIGLYGLVGAAVVMRWNVVPSVQHRATTFWLFIAWAGIALLSTAWSIIPVYSFVRSTQLFVPILLAAFTARIWRYDEEAGHKVFARTIRLFVGTVTALTLLGLVTFRSLPADPLTGTVRFTWPGAHSVAAGFIIGLALIVEINGGTRIMGSSRWVHYARMTILSVGVFLTQTRGALAAVLVAALVSLWLTGRERPLKRYLGLAYLVLAATLVFPLVKDQTVEFVLRGESIETVRSLNGRIPLWEIGLEEVDDADKWITGFGYGAPRVILFQQVEWAGNTHNAWLELLMGTGLPGMTVAIAAALALLGGLLRGTRGSTHVVARMGAAMWTFIVVSSLVASEVLASPGIGFSAFGLMWAFELARTSTAPAAVESGPRPAVEPVGAL